MFVQINNGWFLGSFLEKNCALKPSAFTGSSSKEKTP
jgi:hypothetical protein